MTKEEQETRDWIVAKLGSIATEVEHLDQLSPGSRVRVLYQVLSGLNVVFTMVRQLVEIALFTKEVKE